MDNAPEHFQEFIRENIKVIWNCTAWKQPCDLGIIVALKKRYKFLYINNVPEFHEHADEAKNALKMQEKSQRRGAAGVAYGNPAYLLDAARYITKTWNAISQQTIKNAFIKADLKIWSQIEEEPSNDIVDIGELISRFNNVKISLTSEDIENNIQLDHENN